MRSGVTLRGHRVPGSEPTVVLKAGRQFVSNPKWGGYSIITTADEGLSDMTVKDVLCDQSGNNTTMRKNSDGRLCAYLCEFRGATNVVIDGVYTRNPFTYSIAIVNCTTFGVRNCNTLVTSVGAWDQLDGIHILQSHRGDVNDNYVDQGFSGPRGDGDDGLVAHTIDAPTSLISYRNNTVRGGQNGNCMQLAGGSEDITDIVIQGNTFYGNPWGVFFGYYGDTTSKIERVIIGGAPGLGNNFTDCTDTAVDFSAGPCNQATITHNTSTNSGPYRAGTGTGNVVSYNTRGPIKTF